MAPRKTGSGGGQEGSPEDDGPINSPVVNLDDERAARKPALHAGGGGGTSDGMEARVAKLEAHVEHVIAGIGEIKESLRRLDDLPTKGDLNT